MILIRLMGGLGNQMFQYAFGRAIAIKSKTELVLDQTLLLDKSSSHDITTHRDFELALFKNLNFRWATPEEIFFFNGDPGAGISRKLLRKIKLLLKPARLVLQNKNKILSEYLSAEKNACYVGRWQSYNFFKDCEDVIRADFRLQKPEILGLDEILKDIQTSESVCLHVRRGDLVTSPLYSTTIGVVAPKYYEVATGIIHKNLPYAKYFVFSDDIDWCKENISTGRDTTFVSNEVSGKNSEGHLYLMTKCKHFIISNSTFAWWAAYLSESANKQVIYPKNWYKDISLENPQMCPLNWTGL